MKTSELTPCMICGLGVMHDGNPIFYRVKVEPHVVNVAAVHRRMGEEAMMGPLAGVLGTNPDVAQAVDGVAKTGLVCMGCLVGDTPLARLMED